MCQVSVTCAMQSAQLPQMKQERTEYQDIYAQVLQEVVHRVDKTFAAFFTRVKDGYTPGYPRFKGANRYDSFTYPQDGYEIIGKKLSLSKIGKIRIKQHRQMEGTLKTCTIKREGFHWYAIFTTELVARKEPVYHLTGRQIGVDLGLLRFATLSTGEGIENPRYARRAAHKLASAQQKLARKQRGSHRRNRAKEQVARCHRRVANQRRDFHHKAARKLVNRYGLIVFEDLQVKNMAARPHPKQDADTGQFVPNGATAKGGLNKSIHDVAWGAFVQICRSKAEEAGSMVVLVAPQNTSQVCSYCERQVPKALSERWHSCPHCGLELDRDHNAAINILKKTFRVRKWPTGDAPLSKPPSLDAGCFTIRSSYRSYRA